MISARASAVLLLFLRVLLLLGWVEEREGPFEVVVDIAVSSANRRFSIYGHPHANKPRLICRANKPPIKGQRTAALCEMLRGVALKSEGTLCALSFELIVH